MARKRTDKEILKALERWLKRIPDPEERVYSIPAKGQHLTFAEAIRQIKENTELGKAWLNQLKDMAKRHGQDIVKFINRMKT